LRTSSGRCWTNIATAFYRSPQMTQHLFCPDGCQQSSWPYLISLQSTRQGTSRCVTSSHSRQSRLPQAYNLDYTTLLIILITAPLIPGGSSGSTDIIGFLRPKFNTSIQRWRNTKYRFQEPSHTHTHTHTHTKHSMVWVREQTIPTERPPLVDEVIANFCG
jgi:hypothetical protein